MRFFLHSGARIIVFALMLLAVLLVNYPIQTSIGLALFVAACMWQSQRTATRLLATQNVLALTPTQFEQYVGHQLIVAGWNVRHIGGIGDQGVDLLATLRNTTVAVQCKRYGKACGNGAVQEVVAGARHHGAHLAVVICPSGFTTSARQLARSNGVTLVMHAAELARLV